MIKITELGCAGHFIASDYCRWKRHTQVGNYRVSTIGAYYESSNTYEMKTIGAGDDSFYETMVFKTTSETASNSEGCGCAMVESWGELECKRYATAGEAQIGHEQSVAKYLKLEQGAKKDMSEITESGCTEYSRCGNKATPISHSCPYQSDVNENEDDNYCNCCSDCEHECAMDI